MSEEDAAEVFLLMRRDFRVSRNVRALWYFDHLNRTVQVDNFDTPSVQTGEHESSPEHSHKDIDVVGVVPRRSIGEEDSLPHPNENTTYRIRPDTAVTYLSKLYRLVFVLDLSPSTIVADETSGTVLYTKLLGCLTHCLQGVTRTFNIPGSSRVFSPKLYVTICVNSPFLCSVDDFVLLQGCRLEESNVPSVVEEIERKLTQFVDQLAKNLQPHIHRWNRERRRTRDEKAEDLLTGNLFNHSHFADSIDENHRRHSCSSSTTAFKHGASEPVDPAATLADLGFVRPEWSLISMLRLGLLGAQMLPENTPANMIIISDGVCGMPDAHAMQALLTQLRSFTISCSFIQIQPKIVAHTAFGHVGYPQLYHFLSTATFGTFLPDCPCSLPSNEATSEGMLNPFHRAFLCWSFLRGIGGENVHLRRAVTAINSYFGDNLNSDCVRRRHLSMVYDTCLNNLLYVRLREGYTVKRVWFTRKSGTSNENQHICVELRLPWKPLVSIEYHINADWPPAANDSKAKVRVEVLIEGPYDFLKDVLSDHKGSFQSTYRRDALQAFDYTLNTLVQADKLLLHLHSFSTRTTYYLPPTSVRDGMPLFYMPPAADKPVISSKDLEQQSPEFCEFWRPVCTLDMSIWQKWLHTHSIRLLLTHDVPLSSHLHSVSSQTNRFGQVQCRQAAAVLHDALKDWASFTMMDNHSYIKFVYGDDSSQPPVYFYIIRTCLDPPCLALKIAFLGGIRGAVRNRVVNELRAKLRSLTIRQRSSTITESELRRVVKPTSLRVANTIEVPALVCMKKPLERVLIRYNRVPLVLNRIVRLETVSDQAAVRQIILHNSLTKYLSCRRWIWQLKRPLPASFPVSNEAAAFILHTLVRRRLEQNFRFAAGANGIINVARELMMTNGRECLVQFVIFPPIPATGHHASTRRTRRELISGSTEASESESTEADSEAQLITELWVEPQMGEIADEDEWLNECHVYSCLHRTILQEDAEVIQCLATFEHLSMVCKSRQCRRRGPMLAPLPLRTAVRFDSLRQSMSDAVLLIPSCYNVLALLRHAHRAMLIFPTLTYDEFDPASEARNQLLLDTVHHELVAAHDVSFNPSEDLDDLWSLIAHDPTVDLRDFPWLTDLTSRKSSLASLEDVYRCPRIVVYVKRVSDWRIIITIVPVGVEDLLQLSNGGKRRRTLSLPLFLFNCYEPLLASGLAAADVLSETSPPPVATYFEDHRKSVDASILARLNRQVSRLGHTESSTPSLLNLEPHWFARGRDRGVSEAMMDMDADCDLDFNFIGYCGRFDELLFSRAFVGGVYRCLCEGVYVPKEDILQATDDRCDQFNIEIDSVTQSLNLLCSHFQQYSKTVQDEGINRCYSIDTERSTFSGTSCSQSGPQTDPHPAFRTPSCAGEHEDLRAAFHRLLDEHFRPVPNLPTHYYYVPGPSSLQYPLAAVMNTAVKGLLQPLPTTESEGGDWSRESTDDVSQLTSPTGGPPAEQTIEFVRMTDDESRSEKSAIDDESPSSPSTSSTATSISESLDEPLTCADDLCPLFLQLSCAVRLPNNEMCTFAVDDPPACLADLFAQCGDELEGVWDYDLRNVQVTLDLYLLTTFPTMGPIDLLEAKIPTSPLSEKSPVPSPGLPVGEGVHFTWNCDDDIMSFSAPTAQLSELPEKERVVVEKLKSGVEKLMRIERIFAVTRMDADRVTADALADIITYIEQEANTNDDKRLNGHGVLIGQTPLTLVIHEKEGMERLIARIDCLTVLYVRLRRLGDKYYSCSVDDKELFVRESQVMQRQQEAVGLAKSTEETHLRPEQPAVLCELQNDCAILEEESIAETDFCDDETKDDEDSVVDDAERTLSRRSRTRSFSGCELEHYRQQHERLEEARPLCNHDSTTSLNDVFLDASHPDIHHLSGGITTIRKRTAPPILLEAPIMRNASSAYSACTTSVGGVTEDGYERDLSEYVPTDDHTLNDSYGVNRSHIVLATHQKHYLNDFWLILTIKNNVATVYFCERFAQLHEALFHELQQKLANECRIVNQEMLLEKMNATRECDALIMPEKEVSTPVAERVVRSLTLQKPHVQITEPSTFSPLVRQFVVTRQNTRLLTWTVVEASHITDPYSRSSELYIIAASKRNSNVADEEDQSESTSLTGQARFKFAPGYFACDMVWHHWYFVHPRLKSTTRVSSSQPYNQLVLGMKALTMWLEQLAVRNRENLFVFREHSGHVFYLRLHASLESAEQGGVNLTDSLSPGAIKSNFNHSILLAVHGLTEPGEEICVKMRDELQRRLDAAVLDELVAMLRRNPNFRMTQLDGKFIQPDESKPCLVVKFTLPTPAINYLYAVAHYLRQHLLTFMHMPKFISASGVRLDEWRFRPYVSGDGADVNFFLLNRPAVAGSSTIGLACIEMAFVDSQGLPYSVLRSAPLDARGHSTFFAGDARNSQARQARFYELTKTSIWTTTSGQSMKSKGPTALVQFAVWEKGDVGVEGLQERLRHSVQQALADLVTEYGLLTTPMFELAPPVLPGGQSMSCFALATSSPLGSSPSSPRSLHLTHMPVVLPIESERKDSSPQTPLSASLTPPQLHQHPMHHQQGPRNSIDMLDVQVRRQLQMRRKRSSSEALLNPQSATTTSTPTTSTSATTSPPKPLDSPKTPSLIPAKPPLHVVTSNIFNFDQTAGKRHSVDFQSDEFPPFARRKHSSGGESVSSGRGGLTTSSEQSSNRPSSSARSSPVKRTSSVRMFNPGGRSDRLNTAFATSAADWFDHIMALSKGQNKTPGSLAKMDWRLDSDAACRKIVHIAYERLHEVIPSTDMVVCEGLISVGPGLPRIDPSILSTPILGDMGRIVEAEDKTLAVLVGYSKALTEDTFAFAQDSSGTPPESLRKLATPNSDSNEQRFSPLLQGFVPRRRLLLVLSRGEKLTLYGYNWSQDAITTISSIFLKLVCWHNARSRLLREIGLHKMGVCHLSIPQKPDVEKNPYLEMTWMYPESLLSDNFPPHRLQRPNFAALKADYARLLLKPFRFIDSAFLPRYSSNCAFTNQTRQFLDLRLRLQGILNEQMIMRQIHETWWNMRLHDDEKICIQEGNLQLLHTRSRQVHSVYSPLLLAPKWRRRVAQVRIANEDGAPPPDPNAGRPARKQIERKKSMPITREALPTPSASAAPQSPVKTRSNTMSGTHRHPPASMSSGAMSPTPMPTPTVVRLGADDDEDPWHVKIQYMLVEDYVKYLKTMGMRLIYVQSADKTIRDPLHYNMLSPESPTVWLEQTVEGGIALMRLSFHEPYFRVELFAWDAGQLRYSTTPVDQEQIDQVHQASVEFDKVVADLTIRCHAHSFLYDFHLRMVTTYLIGGQQVMFTPGYNTNAFLIDFLQYYGCRPAFARNCIYEDKTTFKQLSVAGNFIWEHFLNHERIYEWRVVRMKLLHEKGEQNSDFLLVSTDEYQHFDETYKVVRVVLHDERESGKLATDLRLKFYVLLVSSEHNMPFPELDGPALDENEQQVEEGEFKRLEAGSPCDDDLDEAGEDVDVSFEADDKPSSDLLPIRHATLPSQRRRFRSGGSERQSGLDPLYRIHHKLSSDAESVSTVPSGRFQVSRVLEDDLVSAGDRHLLPQPKLSIRKSAPRRHRKSTNKDWVAVLAKEGAVLPKEQITYVTYVSARQRKLQTTLEDSVTHFKRRLQRTVSDAGWHCKRDQLWTRLLEGGAGGAMAKPRSRNATGGFWAAGPPRIETSGVSTVEAAMVLNSLAAGGVMSMADLETLLGYVRVVPAVEIDPNITPFVANLRDDAMLGLMRCLVIHFGPDRCRFFAPGNIHAGSKKHLVVLNPNFLDSLVLVTVAARTNGAKIFLVYKDWDTLISDSSEDNKAYRISVIQSFFEEVVSCLGYFTWQKLLSE